MTTAVAAAQPPAPPGTARHLAWLYAPPESRAAVAALLTLEAEILAGTRPGLEHAVAHARLAWWLEEAATLARGRPRHPLGRPLVESFAAAALSPPDLRGLVEVARLDLACTAFESAPELAEYLSLWTNGLFRNLALLLCPDAASRAEVERFVTVAGTAIRDVELLTRLASDARLGRVHVALEPRTDGTADRTADGHEPWQRQPWPTAQADTLCQRLQLRRAALGRALEALPPPQRTALRAAIVWCALAARQADRCTAALPLQYDAGRFDAPRAAWLAWRAAVAATRGRVPGCFQESR